LSGEFFQQSLFAAVDAFLGPIFVSRTHRNVKSQPKCKQIVNCGLKIAYWLSLCFPFSSYKIWNSLDWRCWQIKMAGIFTKLIWQP